MIYIFKVGCFNVNVYFTCLRTEIAWNKRTKIDTVGPSKTVFEKNTHVIKNKT